MDQLALRVSLVEDHPVLSDLLQEFIAGLPRVRSCSVARSAESALQDIEGNVPDLMLIDLSLPGMNGIELIRELHARYPDLLCAILSGHRSKAYARRALAAGAKGYVLKGEPLEIESAMRAMLAGECYVTPSMTEDG
jgi:DNA-binding NarL/FixJ family response regulator